jgi:phosphatidate phosphatase PAH1
MKYVVDIDGTICDKPECREDCDYHASIPKLDRIAKINKLYDEGHQIIYLTARGMGRHSNNADLAKARFYELTELQLRLWGCKYHELFLGKPSGDFYIDDKGINSDEFFRD